MKIKGRKGKKKKTLTVRDKLQIWFLFLVVVTITAVQGYLYTAKRKELNKLVQIPSNQACMVDDWFATSGSIEAKIEDKTYYCGPGTDGCSKRFTDDVSLRFGIDPLSGNRVDKSTAVIAKARKGKLFYFESEDNLEQYNSR